MVVRVVHARVVDSATHQPRHPPSIHIAVGGEADIFPLHVLQGVRKSLTILTPHFFLAMIEISGPYLVCSK